jgi:hypothetical protein
MGLTLFEVARLCLDADTPEDKVDLTCGYAAAFRHGELDTPEDAPPPEPIRLALLCRSLRIACFVLGMFSMSLMMSALCRSTPSFPVYLP